MEVWIDIVAQRAWCSCPDAPTPTGRPLELMEDAEKHRRIAYALTDRWEASRDEAQEHASSVHVVDVDGEHLAGHLAFDVDEQRRSERVQRPVVGGDAAAENVDVRHRVWRREAEERRAEPDGRRGRSGAVHPARDARVPPLQGDGHWRRGQVCLRLDGPCRTGRGPAARADRREQARPVPVRRAPSFAKSSPRFSDNRLLSSCFCLAVSSFSAGRLVAIFHLLRDHII